MSDVHLSHPSPDRLAAYPLGQLDAAEAAAVAAHLADCPACRATLDALPRDTLQELAQASAASLPAESSPSASAKPAPPLEGLPEQFGPYRVAKLLGRGGMGSVYLAHDPRLDRPVALKVPQFGDADGPHVRERFYREARAAARIDHPNICPVYEVGEHQGTPYLAMRYVEGKPLAGLVSEGRPLGQRQAAGLVGKLALALQVAHAAGVIHRDMKPSNVLLVKGREPVILDFGLARQINRTDARLTKSGTVMGTPAYMAPEQAAGDPDAVGPASDVYSLGVILYELLTGKLPFEGPVAVVLAQILATEQARPSVHRPDLEPQLEAVCLKAMAKQPADRYPTMAAFAAALSAFLRGGGAAQPITSPTAAPATPPASGKAERAAGEAKQTYRVASDETAPPEERPAREAGDTPTKERPRPRRKKGRARPRQPQPSALPRWLAVGGAALALVAGVVGLVVVLRGHTPGPGPGAAAANLVVAGPATSPPTSVAPAEAAPMTTAKAPSPAPARPTPSPSPGRAPAASAPPAAAPAPPLTAEETRWQPTFRVRLARFGRASCGGDLGGKALVGVLLDLTARTPARHVPLNGATAAGLDRDGRRLPAAAAFFPGPQWPASGSLPGGVSVTTVPGDIAIGKERFQFTLRGGLEDLLSVPVLLNPVRGMEYDFDPGRTYRVGLLVAAELDRLTAVRLFGQAVPLGPSQGDDAAPVAVAPPAMPGPGSAGPAPAETEPPAPTPAAPAEAEVYHYVPKHDTTGKSRNIWVRQDGADSWKVGAVGASGDVAASDDGTKVVPDALGSTGIHVRIGGLGYTTLAGLRFRQQVRLDIGEDGTVEVDQVGVRARGEDGHNYISRRVPVAGKKAVVMVEEQQKALEVPKSVEMSDAERSERAAAIKLKVAREFLKDGKRDRARALCEEIRKSYPRTKAAAEAGKLLEEESP